MPRWMCNFHVIAGYKISSPLVSCFCIEHVWERESIYVWTESQSWVIRFHQPLRRRRDSRPIDPSIFRVVCCIMDARLLSTSSRTLEFYWNCLCWCGCDLVRLDDSISSSNFLFCCFFLVGDLLRIYSVNTIGIWNYNDILYFPKFIDRNSVFRM